MSGLIKKYVKRTNFKQITWYTAHSTAVKISHLTKMSTGKRLAKRSILGTRIVAPGHDGRFYPAVIQAVKTGEPHRLAENRYTVRFDNSRKISEFQEGDLIGPGFAGLSNLTQLMAGQRVYITHLGREMEGTIMTHDTHLDQITVNLAVSATLSPLLSSGDWTVAGYGALVLARHIT